jgi:hypothetical protein
MTSWPAAPWVWMSKKVGVRVVSLGEAVVDGDDGMVEGAFGCNEAACG